MVTGGGSQLPLPWSGGVGAGCCCAVAGAVPARTAVMVRTNDNLVTEIFLAASVAKETSPG